MKIGIKYCGGCNPRYNRVEFVSKLKDKYIDFIGFENACEEITYDMLLVIGGCFNCCADHERLKSKHEPVHVCSQEDFEAVCKKIEYLCKGA